ncbi:hypothetical protein Q8F55_002987 [Vanrija albida]|uniref:F-box domain-containing protein n=1 Tax=Vanrija albida TaxID=181172 RepID=A0ABR3QBV1_9TREE
MASPTAQLTDPPSLPLPLPLSLSPLLTALGLRARAAPEHIAARALLLAGGLYALRWALGGVVTALAAVALANLFLAARADTSDGDTVDIGTPLTAFSRPFTPYALVLTTAADWRLPNPLSALAAASSPLVTRATPARHRLWTRDVAHETAPYSAHGRATFLVDGDFSITPGYPDSEEVMRALNASPVSSMAVLTTSAVPAFFSQLCLPSLRTLDLSECGNRLGGASAQVEAYLASPRSHGLETLILSPILRPADNEAVLRGVGANTTLTRVCFLMCGRATCSPCPFGMGEQYRAALERNAALTRRVRRSAIQMLAPARVLLNAHALTPASVPFARLPAEIVLDIVRACADEPGALTGAQFARLRTLATDRQEQMRVRGGGATEYEYRSGVLGFYWDWGLDGL